MKIEKYQDIVYFWSFYYHNRGIKHGLNNFDNKYVGYLYQDKMKGFWLRIIK